MLEALSRTDRVRTADRSSAPNTSENNNRNVLTVDVIRLNSHVKLFLTKSLHLPLQRRGSVRYDSNGMVGWRAKLSEVTSEVQAKRRKVYRITTL